MDKKDLERVFKEELQRLGFKKKGARWYRQETEALQLVDLQKSDYGNQFYVNLCCVPAGMEVEGLPTPAEHKCPIRIRLTAAVPTKSREIGLALDLEDETLTPSEREKQIRTLIIGESVAFLQHIQNADSLRTAIAQGKFQSGAVTLRARQHLGLLA